jgi:hypothetical protein
VGAETGVSFEAVVLEENEQWGKIVACARGVSSTTK